MTMPLAAVRACLGSLLLGSVLFASTSAQAADALVTDMQARIEKTYPAISVKTQTDADQLVLYKDGKAAILNLANLRSICADAPAATCEKQKQTVVTLVGQTLRSDDQDRFPRQVLRLVVRPASYKTEIESRFMQATSGKSAQEKERILQKMPLLRPLGSSFVMGWVLDMDAGMEWVTAERIKTAHLSTAQADQIGAANLQQEKVDPLRADGQHPGVFMTRGNDYLPSVLVDTPFWRRVAGAYADDEVAICLPMRNQLFVYVPRLDSSRAVDFKDMCDQLVQNVPVAFSDYVVRRVDGKWLD